MFQRTVRSNPLKAERRPFALAGKLDDDLKFIGFIFSTSLVTHKEAGD
jgi:hypothetical protein